ncbi:MAG TPA: T9SS type A sorting domain-containing protein, partial [Chitinispirillaceae bacterium]|nr:T9SS type A sorting domain-containing protein [Chitinispirillaceae bacterium]
RTLSSMALFPSTANSVKPPETSPCLEYQFYLFNSGTYTISTYTAPTCAFNLDHGISYAVSIDNETPKTIQNYPKGNSVKATGFNEAVRDNILIRNTSFNFNSSGYHTLKFWMVDPGVVLQKIVINTGGLKPSFLGPPESYFGKMPVSTMIGGSGRKIVSQAQQFMIQYNPASDQLVIRYAVQQDANLVNMNMYDLQGKLVATLLKGAKGGKTAEIHWNANKISKGTYVCRISVDGHNHLSRRIIINR